MRVEGLGFRVLKNHSKKPKPQKPQSLNLKSGSLSPNPKPLHPESRGLGSTPQTVAPDHAGDVVFAVGMHREASVLVSRNRSNGLGLGFKV